MAEHRDTDRMAVNQEMLDAEAGTFRKRYTLPTVRYANILQVLVITDAIVSVVLWLVGKLMRKTLMMNFEVMK